MRRLAAEGTAIVYVSHRLPEILDLADRVTILRDGVGRGTLRVSDALSVNDLIALMVGRSIEAEYPAKAGIRHRRAQATRCWPSPAFAGANFRDVSFSRAARRDPRLRRRRGQRPARRHPRAGRPRRMLGRGRRQRRADPMRRRHARPCDGGLLFLSADRSSESVFPELGVRENMTLQVLDRFASAGLVSAGKERGEAARAGARIRRRDAEPGAADQRPLRRQPAEVGAGPRLRSMAPMSC